MIELQPQPIKLILRRREAADALGISERKLDYLREAGEIASFKMGSAVCISVAELRRWIAEQERKAGSTDSAEVG